MNSKEFNFIVSTIRVLFRPLINLPIAMNPSGNESIFIRITTMEGETSSPNWQNLKEKHKNKDLNYYYKQVS